MKTAALSQGFNGTEGHKTPVWYCHTGPAFRNECFSDECEDSRIKHQGWYTNENGETCRDGSGLARGIVGQLTHGRFIAGYHWGDNGERVYFPDVFDNAQDAAAMANEHARVFAELQREDNAKWNAARDLEIAIEDNLERLRECIGLRNYRQCRENARVEALELCDSIRGMRDSLQTDFADYI